MDANYVKKLITRLGFVPQDGTADSYIKYYINCNNYPAVIDMHVEAVMRCFCL